MLRSILSITFLLNISILFSQELVYFNWDADPVFESVTGPNAIIKDGSKAHSISANYNGTNGLSPNEVGTNGNNVGIDLDLDASGAYFNKPGIHYEIAFRREEGEGHLISRANFSTNQYDFRLNMSGGNLNLLFRLKHASGSGFDEITASNIYSIPLNGEFHKYEFIYNNFTGIAKVLVDGDVKWNNTYSAGRELYWSTPTIRIGHIMDANGQDIAIFDEFRISEVTNPSALPVEWLDFTCTSNSNGNQLEWSTATEQNNHYFLLESSTSGSEFDIISEQIIGAGNDIYQNDYDYLDRTNDKITYYRVLQVDFDGKSEYSKTISCKNDYNSEQISIYPNPAKESVYIHSNDASEVFIYNNTGKLIEELHLSAETTKQINISNYAKGIYFIKTKESTQKLIVQ